MLVLPYNWNMEFKEEIYFKRSLNKTHYETLPTHKALTFSFRPFRFAARALRVAHDCHPTVGRSSLIYPLYVVSGKAGLMKRYET